MFYRLNLKTSYTMTHYKALLLLFVISIFTVSCFEDNDDVGLSANEINDFVWKGMNVFYLYKDDVSRLSDSEFGINGFDDRYGTTDAYTAYLEDATSTSNLFDDLIHEPETIDRFSWITNDYIALEQQFQGNSITTGMEFNLYTVPNKTDKIFGVVRLVLPNSPADNSGLKRGDIFNAIDGTELSSSNFRALTRSDSFTLNFAEYNDNNTLEDTDDSIDPTNESVTLNKTQYSEDPIFKTEIINSGGENIGYLMYNGFTAGSENELNAVFGDFKANNIQHLILDLRYNPGGSVRTTTFLASMITGQYTGEVFEKLVYNSNLQSNNTNFNFANRLANGTTINSLGLTKLYVLATGSSASASEGLINGLAPYLSEIVHIGSNTVGKTQASITLYDSPNFRRAGVNQNHTYAMQPLVANGVNKTDTSVPSTGLTPSLGFEYRESPINFGVLGDVNEPMLAMALADIENQSVKISDIKSKSNPSFKLVMDSNVLNPLEGGLLID